MDHFVLKDATSNGGIVIHTEIYQMFTIVIDLTAAISSHGLLMKVTHDQQQVILRYF